MEIVKNKDGNFNVVDENGQELGMFSKIEYAKNYVVDNFKADTNEK